MAKKDSEFIKRATRYGFKKMLEEVEHLLAGELSEAQRISNEEMAEVIKKHLKELDET